MNVGKQVALLVETSNAYGRGLLRGIVAYAREHTTWSLHLTERGRGEELPDVDDAFVPDGIIARIENTKIGAWIRGHQCPVIDVSAARILPELPWVETDDVAFAHAAADHLLERGLRHFGYCGDKRFLWSHGRFEAFQDYLRAKGYGCSVATGDLAKWLKGLPKPAGVMACYDLKGREVLAACRQENIRTPDDIAVVGVDDDELVCELSDPPLSSVIPDTHRTGWLAAELLDHLMAGRELTKLGYLVPPLGVKTRQSTDMLAIDDAEIAKAVRFIRDYACEGITMTDVLGKLSLSRRVFEFRFQKYLGRTPHAEMIRVRLEKVKELLTQPGWTLRSIASRTGFGCGEYLSAVFKREFGITPGTWRTQNKELDIAASDANRL